MTDIPVEGNDFLASINTLIAEKDAEIARLTERESVLIQSRDEARTNLRAAHTALAEFESNLVECLRELLSDGEDKDMLRRIAEATGINTETEVIKKVTISAEVEIVADIFEEIDDYAFDFRITYQGDDLQIHDSDIEVEDRGY